MKKPLHITCLLALVAGGSPVAKGTPLTMLKTTKAGYEAKSVFTVGESVPSWTGSLNPAWGASYTPPGILDGIGAYLKDRNTVRILVNHELSSSRGYPYNVSDGSGGTFSLVGARVSYFDIDRLTCQVKNAGLAYHSIYDANGNIATDNSFLANNLTGFGRFCSSALFEAKQFGNSGLEDRIYFAPEEDGGDFNPVGGGFWALDTAKAAFWHVPAFGRGAWENLTEIDTGTPDKVAFLLADDSSPFNADGDPQDEAAPLFLYVGTKNPSGNFLERNGLSGGKLYVWVTDNGNTLPSQFNTSGSRDGKFKEIVNSRNLGQADEAGANGFDEYGYPTQRNLWIQAEALGAFGFSRPEDISTNPGDGSEAVLASTGVDDYDVLPSGNGADTFGTLYKIKVDFATLGASLPTEIPARVGILYDGDADPIRALRSPDNLDWADDGFIYVQEDKAENQSLTGEPLFGPTAANTSEAQVVKVHPVTGAVTQLAVVDRDIVLDPSTASIPLDKGAGTTGHWESSGILDVSNLFGTLPGKLFVLDVQAHGIVTQNTVNPDSRITHADLGEGGQLIFLKKDDAVEKRLRAQIRACEKQLAAAKRKGNRKAVRRILNKLKSLKRRLRAML